MKIAPVINFHFRKHFTEIALSIGGIGLIGGWALPTLYKDSVAQREMQKKEVMEKDPKRYVTAIANEPKNNGLLHLKDIYWSKVASDMNDSLKKDSIIQKAYFEGAQMVRDSIAGAK